MSRPRAWLVVLGIVAVVSSGAFAGARQQAQVYATVVSDAKSPVTGLSAGDFVLRDGGVRIGVLGAVPADDPISLAIVVAGFGREHTDDVRAAVTSAVQPIRQRQPASPIGIVEDATVRMLIGPDWSMTIDAALTGERSAIDGVVLACQALRDAPPDRRTVLLIVNRDRDRSPAPADSFVKQLVANRVSLWTIELESAATSPSTPLDQALSDAARAGGSMRDVVRTPADLRAAAIRTANRWLAQYLVTFTWPEPMVSQFSLVTRHDAGEVLTPSWFR